MAIKPIGSQREYFGGGGDGARFAQPTVSVNVSPIHVEEGLAKKLAPSIEPLKEIVGFAARSYREAQTEKIDDELLDVERKFIQFRSEWEAENQGANGEDAGRVFAARHNEFAREALKRMNGEPDEIFQDVLKKRLAQQNLYAYRDGLAYEKAQGQAYKNSQWQGQLAVYKRMCQEHPEDGQAIALEAENLLGSWMMKNPGKDPAAIRMELEDIGQSMRMETLIAQGRYAEARAALEGGVNVTAARESAAGTAKGLRRGGIHAGQPGRGHAIAEDLCNPLNLKRPGFGGRERYNYQAFETDADGFRAAWRQLKLYQKRGLLTPEAMIRTWAPASDGNDVASYLDCVAKNGGINVRERIDMNDAAQAARLIYGMAVRECANLARRYTVEDVTGFLLGARQEGAAKGAGNASTGEASGGRGAGQGAGAMPGLAAGLGVSPLKAARWAKQIEAGEARMLAGERQAFEEPIKQFLARCKDGVVSEMPYSREALVARMGKEGEALYQTMEEEARYAQDASNLANLPASVQAAILDQYQPAADDPAYIRHKELADRLARHIERDARERAADPVAYLLKHDGRALAAWQAFEENQNAETFGGYVRELAAARQVRQMFAEEGKTDPLLDRERASQLARRMAEADNPVLAMSQLAMAAGGYYPAILEQVAPRLDHTALLLSSGVHPDAGHALMQARRNPKFLQEADGQLGLKGAEKQSFDDLVAGELEDISATFAQTGNVDFAQSLRDNVGILARQYMLTRHLEKEEAISLAARELILDRYEIEKSPSGGFYRVPVDPSMPEDVPRLLATYLEKLDLEKIALRFPNGKDFTAYKRRFRNNLKNSAAWVNNQDETGLILCYGPYPVYEKNGGAVTVTWDELASIAASKKGRPVIKFDLPTEAPEDVE